MAYISLLWPAWVRIHIFPLGKKTFKICLFWCCFFPKISSSLPQREASTCVKVNNVSGQCPKIFCIQQCIKKQLWLILSIWFLGPKYDMSYLRPRRSLVVCEYWSWHCMLCEISVRDPRQQIMSGFAVVWHANSERILVLSYAYNYLKILIGGSVFD